MGSRAGREGRQSWGGPGGRRTGKREEARDTGRTADGSTGDREAARDAGRTGRWGAPCTCRVTGGRPPARGRGPAEDSDSFSGPVPCCLLGLDAHCAEAECSQSWGHTGAMALPGAGCISGTGVFSKTVAFSDTDLFSESLALSGTALFPETALSSSTEIFWNMEHLLGLGVSGSRLASGSVSSVQQTASRSQHVPCPPGPPARPAVEEWVPAGPRSPGRAAQTAGPPLTSAPSGASGFFLHWGLLPAANSLCVSWFWASGQRLGSGCCRAPWPAPSQGRTPGPTPSTL